MVRANAGMVLRVLEAAYPYRAESGWMESGTTAEVVRASECVLAALYLAGAPRGIEVSTRHWAEVLRMVRTEGLSLGGAARGLRRRGLREEALSLETPGLLEWAERRVMAGVVLTAASSEYPAGWMRKLGGSAPAALWKRGAIPEGPFLAVVGSRQVRFAERLFATEIGEEAVRLGYAVVSGAAAGCDRAAARGALGGIDDKRGTINDKGSGEGIGGLASINEKRQTINDKENALPLVEILPCGMGMRRERFGGCVLSAFACNEEFSGPNAMRRNALIHSMADATVVVHARFGEGGTWRGAVEANRRRLCRLIVRVSSYDALGEEDRAARALMGLGAAAIQRASDLAGVLHAVGAQGELALEE